VVLQAQPPDSATLPIFLTNQSADDPVQLTLEWKEGVTAASPPHIEQQKYFWIDPGIGTGPTGTYGSFALYDETRDQRVWRFPEPAVCAALGLSFLDGGFSLADRTQPQEDPMLPLRLVGETGDEAMFVRVAKNMDWMRCSASDFVEAVRLALKAGAHMIARDLAEKGIQRYPYNPTLQKMSRLLGPPRVVKNNLPPVSSLKANREWIRAHSAGYRGQWIALREGKLVASAPTAGELKAQIENLEGFLITRIA
jgi:hypothetical protein